jgi:hypothetical protein
MVKVVDEPDFQTELEAIQSTFRPRDFKRYIPKSEFPELFITMPDELETIQLAPLFDVHVGSEEHDEVLFDKHLDWIADTPNVISWDGGDAYENKTPHEAAMGHDRTSPEQQLLDVTKKYAKIQHKLAFKIPGNHEDRTFKQAWVSSSKQLANNLKIPHFDDYCFLTIKWRGNSFRIMVHHGAGGAQTAGAQRNSARKELSWFHPDILWTGHLHQPLLDKVMLHDIDQKTGRMFEREVLVIISPSYLKFYGGYAAHGRMAPGGRGLTVATLNPDGRIDGNVHARGRRL